MLIQKLILICAIVLSFEILSCSNLNLPADSGICPPQDFSTQAESNRNIIGIWQAEIDPVVETFKLVPVNRSGMYHFELTSLYPNVLSIDSYTFGTLFKADLRLVHPLPGSGIDAFDPRVIAILPANPGVSMDYPVLNVHANNSVLLYPDGYTQLWDSPSFAGNTNPFMAYFKWEPNRIWSSTDKTVETQQWKMDISGFGGPFTFLLLVDISTNFPGSPQPGVDNAPEPAEITIHIGHDLTNTGGSTGITATLLDWQGIEGIGGVLVEAPDLFNGIISLDYVNPSGANRYIYRGIIANELLAPTGVYKVLVATWDHDTGVAMCDEGSALVLGDINFDLTDVTPPWLNFSAKGIYVVNDFAYVSADDFDFHIFDVTDPENPEWVNRVDTPAGLESDVSCVYASDGYAYVADYEGFHIVDVDPIESAHIVNSLDIGFITAIYSSQNYAFATTQYSGLHVIDVNPPDSASILTVLDVPGRAMSMHVSGDYAYIASWDAGLQVVDISTPGSPVIVKGINTPGAATDVHVSAGYAFVSDNNAGLQIVDIDPLNTAYIEKNVDTEGSALKVCVSDGYAYVVDLIDDLTYTRFLRIIDIDPVDTASIVDSIETSVDPYDIFACGGYLYVADCDAGMKVIDVSNAPAYNTAGSFPSAIRSTGMDISGDSAYFANHLDGLQILDIETPELTSIISDVDIDYYALDVAVSDGYAYVVNGHTFVVDIDPVESASIVQMVETYTAECIHISGNYAYTAGWSDGVQIINISSPESAYIVNTLGSHSEDVSVDGDCAYIAESNMMRIFNVNPPETAYWVNSVDASGARRVYASGGYAFVGSGSPNGMYIFDVDPLETAHLIKTVETDSSVESMYVSDGYAFIITSWADFQIIDVVPPENAHIVETISTYGGISDVKISGDYAFVAGEYGSKIIRLR